MGSLAPGTGQPDLDSPCRDLRIFFFPDEVDLGRPDIGVAGKFPDLVQSTVTMHLK